MEKLITLDKAVSLIKDGDSVMLGGFMGVGAPDKIILEIIKSEITNLTIITSDTSTVEKPLGKLIEKKIVKKVIASHIGTNPTTGKLMNEGLLEVELVPQGTLAERIRAHGYGLGGILTPTGLGTSVENGKKVIDVDSKSFILELPLGADVSLIKAYQADMHGNLTYKMAARNFNPLMATASKLVIAEVEEIVKTGDIEPDHVVTPGIFVDYIVQG